MANRPLRQNYIGQGTVNSLSAYNSAMRRWREQQANPTGDAPPAPSPEVTNTPDTSGGKLGVDENPDTNAAKILRAQWDRYQNLYTSVEDNMLSSMGNRLFQRNVASAQKSSIRASEIEGRVRSRYGVHPTLEGYSGANRKAEANRNLRERALAESEAYNNDSLATYDRDRNIRTGLVDLGQSLVNQSTGGLVDAAGMQGQRETAHKNAMAQYDANKHSQAMQMASSAGILAGAAMLGGL